MSARVSMSCVDGHGGDICLAMLTFLETKNHVVLHEKTHEDEVLQVLARLLTGALPAVASSSILLRMRTVS